MLSLPHTAGYAIRALGCLGGPEGPWLLAREVARRTAIARPYLSKVLHALRKAGLIEAKRGYRGGFRLARPSRGISLLDVIEAAVGETWMPRCLLGVAECPGENCCPAHSFWTKERARIETTLRRMTLADVARSQGEVDRRTGRRPRPAASGGPGRNRAPAPRSRRNRRAAGGGR
ncbi:MAG: Rrf2 family transcriptional regulator [Planctomycetota bacterium]